MFNITGAITGGNQTNFTTPGYTLSADIPLDNRSKQSIVSALTGTQVGVVAHSVNAPFTVTVRRPSVFKTIAQAMVNGLTLQYSKVPFNEYLLLTRKAAQVAAGQWFTNEWRTSAKIYAGTETYDAANVRAGASCHIGVVNTNSVGFGETVLNGQL